MSTIKADNVQTLAGASTSMANVVNGSARAWVNFNGSGTVTIRQAYNVSSITDNGVGDYTVNFSSALPSVNYAPVLSFATSAQSVAQVKVTGSSTNPPDLMTATQLRVSHTLTTSAAFADIAMIGVAIFD